MYKRNYRRISRLEIRQISVGNRQAHLNNQVQQVQVEEAVILLTDLELNDPQAAVPILQKIYEKGHRGVLLFARNVSDKVMGVLLSINRQLTPFRIVSVKAPDALHGLSEFIYPKPNCSNMRL